MLSLMLAGAIVTPAWASFDDPDGLAPAQLKTVVMTFPEGVSVSPGAADGLAACSDEQLKLGSAADAECPNASKIGTVEITTPALREKLTGGVYLRQPTPDELFRVAITASASFSGVSVKLPGQVRLDQITGQVTATFDNLPQLPFSDLALHFFGGPRAIFANPPTCGTYAVRSVLTSWSGQAPAILGSLFRIGLDDGAACPTTLPFEPTVAAGTVNPVAGASTPFVLRVQRDDGNQELGRIAIDLPAGLTAAPKQVPLCPSALATAGTCGDESQIGTVAVGAGPGSAPLYLRGKVYLTDSYGGAPFGLSIVVPAIAGPFDLGTVVVRAAVRVDPHAARLRVEADPLPRILDGIPLQLRDLQLQIDRPGFIRNPTNCTPTQVVTEVTAVQGATASRANRFQVGDCAALRLSPRLSVKLTSRRKPTRDRPLGLLARLRTRAGDANLRSVAFTLPPDVAFDALNRRHPLCTRAQLAARQCPPNTRVGSAAAVTPLLARPLTGPVFFVHGVKGDVFPKLAMMLDGQLKIDLLGSTTVNGAGLRTSFGTLPDVPISQFTLALNRGLLTPTDDLCKHRPTANLTISGQNGRVLRRHLRVSVPCRS